LNIAKWSLQPKMLLPPLLVFIVAFAGYLATPRSSQVYSDSRWSIHLALSVIREGNLNLEEYKRMITPDDYAIRDYKGHKYSFYPIGAPLLAIPFVLLYNLINPNTFEMIGRIHPVAQVLIASFMVALTAAVIYLIAHIFLTIKQSLLVAFIFAFCTPAWSTGSRALWQHTPSMLVLSLALYLLLLARDKPWLVQFVSIPLAYSYLIRPLNAVSIIFLSLFVLLNYRKYFIKYMLWSCLITLPFLLMNYWSFGTLLPFYYQNPGVFSIPSIERLLGPFISPSRGLFLYTPIFLLSIYGIFLKLKNIRKNYPQNLLDITLTIILMAHSLLISAWWMWWGGYSIGPRMFTDMIPYLTYFLLPVVAFVGNATRTITPLRITFFACLLISFFIQFQGIKSEAMWGWNNVPTDIDLDQGRLWDWGDPQFLRGFTLFHNTFPPGLGTDPAEINLYCTVGDDEKKCKTSIELFVRPWQAFNWEANPPPGVIVVPARGQDFFKRPRLAIRLTKTDFSPGVYDLGELKIAAIEKEGAQLSKTITVPIILYLEPAAQP
jgi:hypothetical protein